jgi:release factor glutamine methyltransferase
METLKQIYIESQKRLRAAGVENPAFDAACIIEKHTGVKRHEIVLYGGCPSFNPTDFWADIERRERREPLQYIVGMWHFYGLDFFVGRGVLIPRQDTEVLADTAINFLKSKESPSVLDLCAGSGCVSTVILKNVENSSAVCVELSNDAAFYLEKNLEYNGIKGRARIVKADMLSSSSAAELDGRFDAIVCNPPYIKSSDIEGLQPEVAQFEPHLALDGGTDGLVFYRAVQNYLMLLKAGGMAVFEVGIGQSNDVAAILENYGLSDIFIKRDFSGIERVVGGYYK